MFYLINKQQNTNISVFTYLLGRSGYSDSLLLLTVELVVAVVVFVVVVVA